METEKDKEIERLKRELERASKEVNRLAHEHQELRKDRAKKDEELKCAFSKISAKDAELESLKRGNSAASRRDLFQTTLQLHNRGTSAELVGHAHPISEYKSSAMERTQKSSHVKFNEGDPSLDSRTLEINGYKRKDVQTDDIFAVSDLKRRIMIDDSITASNACFLQRSDSPEKAVQPNSTKAIGVQTELGDGCSHTAAEDVLSSKLLAIWGSPAEKRSGRHLLSKLFAICSEDFYVLFRFMGMPTDRSMASLTDGNFSDMALHDHMQSIQSVDAAKLSQFYVVLMKISKEMEQLDNLLEVLTDLCDLDNVIVVHRSLRILHAVLQNLSSFDIGSYKRDNVVITRSQNNTFQEQKKSFEAKNKSVRYHETETEYRMDRTSSVASSTRAFTLENPCKNVERFFSNSTSLSLGRRISLIETMHQIAVSNKEEHIQVEAVSIISLILLRSELSSEWEKFGLISLFGSVSHLLSKEVGLCVQRQAVQLLFLLLNCPKLLKLFCHGHEDNAEHAETADGQKDASRLQVLLSTILMGLVGCISCRGNSTLELKLRREAIILLAFIASSGKSGFEILLSSVTPQGVNFLELIVRVLASEMDVEAADFVESQDIYKERTALMREALILLNRLASNAVYSKATLGVLTQDDTMVTLTFDVVNRISQNGSGYFIHDSKKKDVEIVDLARLFKTRLLSFLGSNVV